MGSCLQESPGRLPKYGVMYNVCLTFINRAFTSGQAIDVCSWRKTRTRKPDYIAGNDSGYFS